MKGKVLLFIPLILLHYVYHIVNAALWMTTGMFMCSLILVTYPFSKKFSMKLDDLFAPILQTWKDHWSENRSLKKFPTKYFDC